MRNPRTHKPAAKLRSSRLFVTVIVFLFLVIGIIPASVVSAAPGNGWSPQLRIPDYGDESRPPYLVADQDRNVYAFNTQPNRDGLQAIFYRQWSVDQGWSPPNDILLSPLSGAPIVQGVFLDKAGTIYLIFFAGNEQYGAIFYTRAPAYLAGNAQAWSKPVLVGNNALGLGNAFVGDDHGNLFIVYSGIQNGVGLYSLHSLDGGITWSSSVMAAFVHENNLQPNGTQLAIDPQDRLHVVWSVVNSTGIDQAVYYARLESDHVHWSEPVMLAKRDPGDYKAAWPSIIFYNGRLIVIYQDSNPATRWMRQSFDGGQTWSDPVQPWPHVGEYNAAVLLIDSNKVLHIILGNRNGECCHGMWHGVWSGESWGALEPVVIGPKTSQFDPSMPQAVISQGNVLLSTWWTDTGGGPRNGAWYSYKILGAPALPIIPLPKPHINNNPSPTDAPDTTLTLSGKVTYLATPTPNAGVNNLGDYPSEGLSPNDPGIPVAAGVVPGVLLLVGLILMRRFFFSGRR